MSNLGEILKSNIAAAEAAAAEAERLTRERATEEHKKKEQAVAEFFHFAKSHIAAGIKKGDIGAKLNVKLGVTDTKSYFPKANEVLRYAGIGIPGYSTDKVSEECRQIAAPHWADFQGWVEESGLSVKWEHAWDGGGRFSWTELQVRPRA